MNKPTKIILIGGVATLSFVWSMLVHHRFTVESEARQAHIREQGQQLLQLTAERKQMADALDNLSRLGSRDYGSELSNLRAEVKSLRQKTNELAMLLKLRTSPPSPQSDSPAGYLSGATLDAMPELVRSREDTRKVASAILTYTLQHEGRVPSDLSAVTGELQKITTGIGQAAVETLESFEIVYHGSLADLSGIPNGAVAVVRYPGIWAAPDGRAVRIYGMLDGHPKVVTSDDNFRSWEATHVVDSTTSSSKPRIAAPTAHK
jgi:hypothetical protein